MKATCRLCGQALEPAIRRAGGSVCEGCATCDPIHELARAINTAPKMAEAPFTLTGGVARRPNGKQGGLFE